MLLVKFAKLENFQANNRLLQYSGQIRKKLQGLNFKGSEKVHEKIAVNKLFRVPINLQTSIKFLKKNNFKIRHDCLPDRWHKHPWAAHHPPWSESKIHVDKSFLASTATMTPPPTAPLLILCFGGLFLWRPPNRFLNAHRLVKASETVSWETLLQADHGKAVATLCGQQAADGLILLVPDLSSGLGWQLAGWVHSLDGQHSLAYDTRMMSPAHKQKPPNNLNCKTSEHQIA